MSKYWRVFLIRGVGYTLALTSITVFFGAILGIFICLARMSKSKVLNSIALNLGEIVRGTPMLLQLYVFYLGLPRLFPGIPTFVSVSIGFILNSACYVSEVFRSGIQAVDKGQTEAARSLGLSGKQTMTKIVLPQAVKNILPALGNEFITITKDTSLASTFFVGEVMTSYLIVKGNTFLTMECLFIVAVIYYVMTLILNRVVGRMERRMRTSD
ncbi:MAG: amino acid ABC transporter permease [Firmicutes bacterium]|nr:amino acid ABC transporter permease [Bacillota bacterium]MBQ1579990.1 amino acid ABC transporter permease [Bacillota bacterium]MBQ2083793.1 amino acid ABC transporter permease [Bacillota bacterium]MBQ2228004.1 amino acid ABC transporter permease [Bacillota bacterium]MBQ4004069.1 amino acid ABC transporter permease [Bacillota bacterium]